MYLYWVGVIFWLSSWSELPQTLTVPNVWQTAADISSQLASAIEQIQIGTPTPDPHLQPSCRWESNTVLAATGSGFLTEPFRQVAAADQPPAPFSEAQLQTLARSITVKVLTDQNAWASGILVQKRGQRYMVLTVQHLIRAGNVFRVQTSDGRTHQATVMKYGRLQGQDLALLQFQSKKTPYPIAALNIASELTIGDEVFAVGFPLQTAQKAANGFFFTRGKVTQLLNLALVGGYEVGYSNDVIKGMSGGSVLNRQGEVVAVNGIHKYPLWGNPYVFKDGTVASSEVQERMSRFSWAIPIKTFLQLAPQFAVKDEAGQSSLSKCLD